jgi:hypothetical protein
MVYWADIFQNKRQGSLVKCTDACLDSDIG